MKCFSLPLTVLFLLFGRGEYCFGQDSLNTRTMISSPTAASLGKYGDIPVGLHTGIPNLQIPIYTVQSGPLKVPVSLSYHASGLKVQEQASWVGAGWSLNAGGVITRSIVGALDDKGQNGDHKGYFSDFGIYSYLFNTGNTNLPLEHSIETGQIDGEPDLYFFNFNGYTGKFYFNDDRTAMIVPEQDLRIKAIYSGTYSYGISGFIITTPDGVTYYFGHNPLNDGNPNAIDITHSISSPNYNWLNSGASSSWYLNRIVSADANFSISLIYETESYSSYGLGMFPVPPYSYNLNPKGADYGYNLTKNFVDGVRLAKIIYPTGEVDFTASLVRKDLSCGSTHQTLDDNNPNMQGMALSAITIKSATSCRNFNFYDSYFYDNATLLNGRMFTIDHLDYNLTSDKYRLRLDSLKETSCDNTVSVPAYKFAYFPGTVSRKLGFGVDHWGFYNGITTNWGLIPTYTILPTAGTATALRTFTGADRDTHWPNSLNGSLQQITYPTGGTSTLNFESNSINGSITSSGMVQLADLIIGLKGQNQGNQLKSVSQSITTNGTALTINTLSGNSSSWQATLTIANATYKYSVLIATSAVPNQSIVLPAGTYSATVAYLSGYYYAQNNGVEVQLSQAVSSSVISNQAVGGIRIKSITNAPGGTANSTVQSYRYTYDNTDNGSSSGLLFSKPIYAEGLRNDIWALYMDLNKTGCLDLTGTLYYISPASTRPMSVTQGNHIGYGDVWVAQTGNGYSENRYYSSGGQIPHIYDAPQTDVCVRAVATFCNPSIPNSPAPPDPFDPMRGELSFQGFYNQAGLLLKSVSYLPAYQQNPILTPGIISRSFTNGISAQGNSVFTEYTLQTARKVSDQLTTTTYDALTGLSATQVSTTLYASPYHHQVTQSQTNSSKGEQLIVNYKRAFDLQIPNFSVTDQLPAYVTTVAAAWNTMSLAISRLNSASPNFQYTAAPFLVTYQYNKAIARQAYLSFRRSNYADSLNAFQLSHNTAKVNASAEYKPVLELQDEYQNPIIEKSTLINGNLTGAQFTHYDYQTGVLNPVYPTIRQVINVQNLATTFTSTTVSGSTLNKDLRYTNDAGYTFSNGNLSQLQKLMIAPTSYKWGNSNQDILATIENASPLEVYSEGFEESTAPGTVVSPGHTGIRFSTTALVNWALPDSKSYFISYWRLVSGIWQYVPEQPYTGSFTMLGGAGYDDIRIFPKDAKLTTYTYNQDGGMTSMTDAKSNCTFYEYDALGRLALTRDNNGKIINAYQLNYRAGH